MSRAFVKESDQGAPPPERMVAEGPHPVTESGLALIEAEVARLEAALKDTPDVLLRETLERDLRYWAQSLARAEVQPAPSGGRVAFGSLVRFRRAGREQSFRIVGEDEAAPARGLISFRSPLAQALLGAGPGDVVEMARPKGEIEVLGVE